MKHLEIGTKVKLTAQGVKQWAYPFTYAGDEMNPKDTVGEVIKFTDASSLSRGFTDRVKWANGNDNSYMPGDLEVVTE